MSRPQRYQNLNFEMVLSSEVSVLPCHLGSLPVRGLGCFPADCKALGRRWERVKVCVTVDGPV